MMSMKTIYGILILFGMLTAGTACHDDENLSPEFKYTGPYPEIVEGTTEAQKICYDLYKKYDHHTYYTLSGDDALRTNLGTVWAENNFWYLWDDPFPLEAGDEETSTSFLKLLRSFYDNLPEELAKSIVIKRQILIKANLWNDELTNSFGFYFPESYAIGYIDDAPLQGYVYWGDMDDDIGIQPEVWKSSIFLSFFRTRGNNLRDPNLPEPKEFVQVSAGRYLYEIPEEQQEEEIENIYDLDYYEPAEGYMEYLMGNGFISPFGFLYCTTKEFQSDEMATYATWIACNSLEDRQEILNTYPLVKKKYDLTVKYYKHILKLNLEAFRYFLGECRG